MMRRRIARLDRHPDDPAAARLDDVAADDRVFGPVGAFDEHVRLQRARSASCGVSSSKIDDGVDARERREHSARSASGVIGRSGPLFARTDRSELTPTIERVAERARLLQVAQVARDAADRTRRW